MSQPILILTALEVERVAIEQHVEITGVEYHPETGTDYVKGTYTAPYGAVDVVICRTDQTNVNAALETERAIQHFNPHFVFYAWVAGGLKDVKVGDIVIGTEVLGYERGKAEENNFKPRPQFGASSYDLERLAASIAKDSNWLSTSERLLDTDFSHTITVFTGTIASGEKVDASYASELHKHIKQNASHALAIEMEGLGFLTVCRSRPAVKSLLLRGISDLVNNKGEMDGKGSQPYASLNVAAFLFCVIDQLDTSSPTYASDPYRMLVEIMCKLYPRGMEDQGIWVRAGGDLSLVPMNRTGKGQWAEAIRLVKLGGGGSISTKTLLAEVSEDFPANVDVAALRKSIIR